MAVDEPFYNSNGLIDLLPGEQVLASLTVNVDNNEVDAVWLAGDFGWRITAVTTLEAGGRIKMQIRRNGQEIYKKEQDAYIPMGSLCTRTSLGFMHVDLNPGYGPVTYQLTASIVSAENTEWFMVNGPVTFAAGGLKKLIR